MEVTSLSAIPLVVPSVKPESGPKRVLLLASEAVFESEVRAALEREHQSGELPLFFDLVYLDFASDLDFSRSSIYLHMSGKVFLTQTHQTTYGYLVTFSTLKPSGATSLSVSHGFTRSSLSQLCSGDTGLVCRASASTHIQSRWFESYFS